MRAGREKAFRAEAVLYRAALATAQAAGTTVRAGRDGYAFTLAFKGVFLAGLEVAWIVLAFGTSQGSIPLAALGAGIAPVLGVAVGVSVPQPLSRVPENTRQSAVGLMPATFGLCWSVEGTGLAWPGADVARLGLLALRTRVALGPVAGLRRTCERQALMAANAAGMGAAMLTALKNCLRCWYAFMVGDDWMTAAGVVMALAWSAALARRGLHAWWVVLVPVVVMRAASLWRETRRARSRRSAERDATRYRGRTVAVCDAGDSAGLRV